MSLRAGWRLGAQPKGAAIDRMGLGGARGFSRAAKSL